MNATQKENFNIIFDLFRLNFDTIFSQKSQVK